MNLVLENRQAPGDILMMTCAVRDLHRAHPGAFNVEPATSCLSIWHNNPGIKQVDRSKPSKMLKIGYSAAINNSNQRSGHFAGGFGYDLSNKLSLKIPLTDIRPDIYLTDAEKDPAKAQVKGDYWVIFAGGKADFTAKLWDNGAWQDLANILHNDFQLVHVGNNRRFHPRLRNTVDLVEKTDFRQLMALIYHSKGVICPVTCGSHIAAGLNKPCVVIAGGREAWWWEAYTKQTWALNCTKPVPEDFVEQTYIHMMGKMPCCDHHGCWKSGVGDKKNNVKNCSHVVRGLTMQQPACLFAIKPEIVAAAARAYYGGPAFIQEYPLPNIKPALWMDYSVKLNTTNMIRVQRTAGMPVRPPKLRGYGRHKVNTTARVNSIRGINIRRKYMPQGNPVVVNPDARLIPAYSPYLGKQVPLDICVLTYGDFTPIVSRCVGSIFDTVDTSLFTLRLGLNAVSDKTRKYAEDLAAKHGNVRLYTSETNIFKYPMMRKMFSEPALDPAGWVIWFDDDSHCIAKDWFQRLDQVISMNPNAAMLGKPYNFGWGAGNVEWVKRATWYRGLPILQKHGKYYTNFFTGGFWAIKNSAILALDWPDPRLLNNGGDTNLGEACRQNGFILKSHHYGISISDHKRRGASQKHPVA